MNEHSLPSRGTVLLRPLTPIDGAGHFASRAAVDVQWISKLLGSETYQAIVAYFDEYPPDSLMDPTERALLYCLVRALKPENAVEIGTYYAGTTEVLARAVWENGFGCLNTIDPFGADRVPSILAAWHQPLKAVTSFSAADSMSFLTEFIAERTPIDFVLVDGEHDFEFVRFDLELSARLLRPGGIIVLDDADQAGPFAAAKYFLADHPEWRELGDCVARFAKSDPFDGRRGSVPGTRLLILQAPSYLVVEGNRFRSWGQQRIPADRITGFELELADAVGSGNLHVQTVLRTFGDGQNRLEIASSATVRIELTEQPHKIRHQMETPLVAVSERGAPVDYCTAEIVLFWEPEQATGMLKLRTPPRPLLPRGTQSNELRPLIAPAEWDGVTGLEVIPIDADPVIADFPILQLVAAGTEGVHSLSVRSQSYTAGEIYRASVWVNAQLNANLRLIVRDSVNAQTGRPTNEIEIKVDLHSRAIIQSPGDILRSGIEQAKNDWQVIWVDLRPADEKIFIALFLLEGRSNCHVFMPTAQRILFGGFDIRRLDTVDGYGVTETLTRNEEQNPNELENALAVIRKHANDEAVAGRLFDRALTDLVKPHHRSLFWGDRLLTIDKSAGFRDEPGFKELLAQVDPSKGCNQYASPDRLGWRLHTLIWAASCALKVPGDFIECGVTHGDMPWVMTEVLDFQSLGKSFYAYDTFEGFDFRYSSELDFPESPQFFHLLHAESRQDPHRHERVCQRFSAKPYVKIIKGVVPDILREIAPEEVAFLHLDMNAPYAQKGALELLFDRLSHGAIVMFDDYGWVLYHREKEVADEFFGARGHKVLELPTGQGLVIIDKTSTRQDPN